MVSKIEAIQRASEPVNTSNALVHIQKISRASEGGNQSSPSHGAHEETTESFTNHSAASVSSVRVRHINFPSSSQTQMIETPPPVDKIARAVKVQRMNRSSEYRERVVTPSMDWPSKASNDVSHRKKDPCLNTPTRSLAREPTRNRETFHSKPAVTLDVI